MVKGPNFYKILYIYTYIYIYILKIVLFFFFINDVKDTTNFTIDLQIAILLITKK